MINYLTNINVQGTVTISDLLTANGGINLTENLLNFGTLNNDMSLSHDGSNGYLDVDTGDFYIRNSSNQNSLTLSQSSNLSVLGNIAGVNLTGSGTLDVTGQTTLRSLLDIVGAGVSLDDNQFITWDTGTRFTGNGSTLVFQTDSLDRYIIDASGDHNFQAGNITTTGTITGNKLYSNNQATANNELVRLDQLNSIIGGLDWQESVLDQLNLVTSEPASPTIGDRYISLATGTSSTTSQAVTIHYIYEWNGTDWTEFIPNEGWTCWVEDVDTNFTYNGSTWVEFGSTVSHNNTTGLQGGQASQYYHLNLSDYTNLTADSANLAYTNVDNNFSIGQTINPSTGGSALEWKESDSNTVAGQLRSYANRGDIYLFYDGVKTVELTAAGDNYINSSSFTVGGTDPDGNKFRVLGTSSLEGNTNILGEITFDYSGGSVRPKLYRITSTGGLAIDTDGTVSSSPLVSFRNNGNDVASISVSGTFNTDGAVIAQNHIHTQDYLRVVNTYLSEYDSTNTDITSLVSGSTFGAILEGPSAGHLVIGIKGNDSGDGFSIIGRSDYNVTPSYDELLFEVNLGGAILNKNLTMNGDIKMGDSDIAYFGTGNDLRIYHNGSNSYIQDAGTGELRVLASTFSLRNAGDTELMLTAVQDGAVNLYHNNNLRLSTTSLGADVNGALGVIGGSAQIDLYDRTSNGDSVRFDFSGGQYRFRMLDDSASTNVIVSTVDLSNYLTTFNYDVTVNGNVSATDGTNTAKLLHYGLVLDRASNYITPATNAGGELFIGGSSKGSTDWTGIKVYTDGINDFKWNDEIVATQDWIQAQGYITSQTDSQTLSWNSANNALSISNGNTVNINTFGSGVTISTTQDQKLVLRAPSGDTTEWNYMGFVGTDGVRDGFFGVDPSENLVWNRDTTNNSIHLKADGTNEINGDTSITGTLEVSSNISTTNGFAQFVRNADATTPITLLKLENQFTGQNVAYEFKLGSSKELIIDGTSAASKIISEQPVDITGTLDVSGNLNATGDTHTLGSGSQTGQTTLLFQQDDNLSNGFYLGYFGAAANDFGIYGYENAPFRVYTNGTLGLTLDASQNLNVVGKVTAADLQINLVGSDTAKIRGNNDAQLRLEGADDHWSGIGFIGSTGTPGYLYHNSIGEYFQMTHRLDALSGISVGTSSATTGEIRLPNNATIQARNAANTGNRILMRLDTSDILQIAESGTATSFNDSIFIEDNINIRGTASGGAIGFNRNTDTGALLNNTYGAFQLQSDTTGRIVIQTYAPATGTSTGDAFRATSTLIELPKNTDITGTLDVSSTITASSYRIGGGTVLSGMGTVQLGSSGATSNINLTTSSGNAVEISGLNSTFSGFAVFEAKARIEETATDSSDFVNSPYHLELRSPDTLDSTDYISIRFHHINQTSGAIRYNSQGFFFQQGNSSTYRDIYIRDLFSSRNVIATGDVQADEVLTTTLRTSNGQELILNAGESVSYATGQTGENVYINAESGLEINYSPDNWASLWAGRKTHLLGKDAVTFREDTTIYGSASDTSSNAFTVRNLANTALFSVRNDGRIDFSGLMYGDGSALTNIDADTLDSLLPSQFLRSDITDAFTGSTLIINNTLKLNANAMFVVSGSDNAMQRVDARTEDTDKARLYWYGLNSANDTNDRFRQAWYNGSKYYYVDAQEDGIKFGNATTTNGDFFELGLFNSTNLETLPQQWIRAYRATTFGQGSVAIGVGNADRLIIDYLGNVGIGATPSTSHKFVVAGNIVSTNGKMYLSSGNQLHFDYNGSNDYAIRKSASDLAFTSGGDFTFNSNVDITGNLDVSGTAAFAGDIYVNSGNIRSTVSEIEFLTNAGGALPIRTASVLTSNNYSDSTKVPTNGIYSLGGIRTDKYLYAEGNGTFTSGIDSATNAGVVINEGDYIYAQISGNYLRKLIGINGSSLEVGHPGTSLITEMVLKPGSSNIIKGEGRFQSDYDLDVSAYGAFHVERTLGSSRTTSNRGFADATIWDGNTSSLGYAGVDIRTNMNNGAYDHITSFQARPSFDTTTIIDVEGVSAYADYVHDSTITNFTAFSADKPFTFDNSTITNFYGLKAAAGAGINGASITNFYGMYIGDGTVDATNKYAIFSDDNTVESKHDGKFVLGDGLLSIYTDTSIPRIEANTSLPLFIENANSSGGGIVLRAANSSGTTRTVISAGFSGTNTFPTLYYDTNAKLVTTNTGVEVTGDYEYSTGEVAQKKGEFDYNTDASTSYTIASTDKGEVIGFTSASAVTVTVNAGSLTDVGDICYIDQMGSGEITIAAGAGNSLLKNGSVQLKTNGLYSRVAIHKVGSTSYRVFGELKPV